MLESGASNLFIVIKDNNMLKLVTHPLDGCVLPGIIRNTIIELTKTWTEF